MASTAPSSDRSGPAASRAKPVRLFVALDIPDAIRTALTECTAPLAKLCRSARWVRLEGAHVTLKFIGEVAAERAEAIRLALAEVRPFAPVDVCFAGLGFFPNAQRPRVLWAGIEAGPALSELAAAVDERLAPLGVARETREFRPHVMLARFGSPKGLDALRAAVAKLGALEFGRATAQEFCLYQSVLRPSGAEYTRLATYAFPGVSAS
jgi:RNA 2',3'-cyclic 3'-phosphodiesterase